MYYVYINYQVLLTRHFSKLYLTTWSCLVKLRYLKLYLYIQYWVQTFFNTIKKMEGEIFGNETEIYHSNSIQNFLFLNDYHFCFVNHILKFWEKIMAITKQIWHQADILLFLFKQMTGSRILITYYNFVIHFCYFMN